MHWASTKSAQTLGLSAECPAMAHLRQRAADGVQVRPQPVAEQVDGRGHALQHSDLRGTAGWGWSGRGFRQWD